MDDNTTEQLRDCLDAIADTLDRMDEYVKHSGQDFMFITELDLILDELGVELYPYSDALVVSTARALHSARELLLDVEHPAPVSWVLLAAQV